MAILIKIGNSSQTQLKSISYKCLPGKAIFPPHFAAHAGLFIPQASRDSRFSGGDFALK
jgi:hypothetical protein